MCEWLITVQQVIPAGSDSCSSDTRYNPFEMGELTADEEDRKW